MTSMYVQSRISNFIHRKVATSGEEATSPAQGANKSSGIYYEALAMPRKMAKER